MNSMTYTIKAALEAAEYAAHAAVEHVGSANYRHRVQEAHEMIDAAVSSVDKAVAALSAPAAEQPVCRNCVGQGWEPTMHNGRIPCSHCQPIVTPAPASKPESLEEALMHVLIEHTQLSTDAIDERVEQMVQIVKPTTRFDTSSKASEAAQPAFPERDQSKPAEQQGIFRKFIVTRVDGSDQPGGKHHGCRYFVLDMDHDAHAPAALRTYADSCAETHPQLAADLRAEFGSAAQPAPARDDVLPDSWIAERIRERLTLVGHSLERSHLDGDAWAGTTDEIIALLRALVGQPAQQEALTPLQEKLKAAGLKPWRGQPAQAVTLTDDDIFQIFKETKGADMFDYMVKVARRLLAGSAKTAGGAQ